MKVLQTLAAVNDMVFEALVYSVAANKKPFGHVIRRIGGTSSPISFARQVSCRSPSAFVLLNDASLCC